MDSQKFCLKWDSFQSSVTSVFDRLRQDEELVDITLCCEGQSVQAHRVVLSACSPYFRELLRNKQCQQMLVFLKDTSASDLHAIVEFMYKGSVNVSQSQLASFLKTAETLQIRGLSGDEEKSAKSPPRQPAATTNNGDSRARPAGQPGPPRPGSPPGKRRRLSTSDPVPQAQFQPPPPPQQLPSVLPGDPGPAQAAPPLAAALSAGASRTSDGVSSSAATAPASSERESEAPHMHHPHPPVLEEIKREKQEVEVDLGSEDDASLDATLGYVADYEGGYSEHEAALQPRASDITGYGGGGAGPSQRHVTDDSASADPFRYTCTVCGKVYKHRESLNHHRKKHEGLTTCTLCGKVCCIVAELRRHLELIHGLTQEEVRTIVPTKPKERIMNFSAGAGLYPASTSGSGSNDPRVSELLPSGGIYSKLIDSRATFDATPDLASPMFLQQAAHFTNRLGWRQVPSNSLWSGVAGDDGVSGGDSKLPTRRRLEMEPSCDAGAENRKDSGEDDGRVAAGAKREFGSSVSTDGACENAPGVASIRVSKDIGRPVSEAPS